MKKRMNDSRFNNFDKLLDVIEYIPKLHKFSESKLMLKAGYEKGLASSKDELNEYISSAKNVAKNWASEDHTIKYHLIGIAKGIIANGYFTQGVTILGEFGVLKNPTISSYVANNVKKAFNDVNRNEEGFSKSSSQYFKHLEATVKSYM
jgi:hypothetical protein